jgi:phage terminase large subunit
MESTKSKRATVYFHPDIHRALRLKAAASERSISEIVDEAVRQLLAEDAEDLAAIRDRADEATDSFEEFVEQLKRDGAL